jgi:hypothetical protein
MMAFNNYFRRKIMAFKMKQVIFSPIPDEEGFNLMHCYNCDQHFLVKVEEMHPVRWSCCPYCDFIGGVMTFTRTIRNRFETDKNNIITPEKHVDRQFVTDEWIQEQLKIDEEDEDEDIEEVLESIGIKVAVEPPEVEVISYSIGDVYDNPVFITQDLICCDQQIKIPFENIDSIKRCPYCYSEIKLPQ